MFCCDEVVIFYGHSSECLLSVFHYFFSRAGEREIHMLHKGERQKVTVLYTKPNPPDIPLFLAYHFVRVWARHKK